MSKEIDKFFNNVDHDFGEIDTGTKNCPSKTVVNLDFLVRGFEAVNCKLFLLLNSFAAESGSVSATNDGHGIH
jgi:uncharacterized protein (UPF0212 family)